MERYTEVCGDNRFELIDKYKQKLIEATNIETSKEEMNVIDNILFRFWQMGWVDKLEADVVPRAEVEKARQVGFELGKTENIYGHSVEQMAKKVEKLSIELEAMRGAANSYKMHYEQAKQEVARLQSILLQFTDIVHKWGAKNNLDTTEISLVPILEQEADGIIEKAKQEVAKEIFEELEKLIISRMIKDVPLIDDRLISDIAELQKKYIGE